MFLNPHYSTSIAAAHYNKIKLLYLELFFRAFLLEFNMLRSVWSNGLLSKGVWSVLCAWEVTSNDLTDLDLRLLHLDNYPKVVTAQMYWGLRSTKTYISWIQARAELFLCLSPTVQVASIRVLQRHLYLWNMFYLIASTMSHESDRC
jgi:hypothetical protein